MQGWRPEMEDAHILEALPGLQGHFIFGVFDGHGGDQTAKLSAQLLVSFIESQDTYKQYISQCEGDQNVDPNLLGRAIRQGFIDFDEHIYFKDIHKDSGCTSCVTIVAPTFFLCANSGDSRCVIGSQEGVQPLSYDHKPTDLLEEERIINGGGTVSHGRVDGELAVSRSFGDFRYKDMTLEVSKRKVSCIPDIKVVDRSSEDDFLVLACDGLWDVFSNEEGVNSVRQIYSQLKENEGYELSDEAKQRVMQGVAENMLDLALNKGSKDNISCIVLKFSH